MKKLSLFFIAIYSSYFLASAQDNTSPYLTKSLASENIRSVNLQTSGGSLTVEGVAGSQARLEVFVQGNNGNNRLTKEEIEQRLQDYDLQISTDNGQLVATAKPKNGFKNWRKSVSISFRAYVPQAASAKLKTSGGSLSINGINGLIEGETSGGSIKIAQVKNNVNLKTSGGSINAADVAGNLLLHTSGGSIKLSNLKGKIDAQTSGGSIGANDISGELLAKTSGGSIRVDRMTGSADLATSAGSTSVNMVNVDKYLKIDVSAGSVNLQLPMDKGLDLNLSAGKVNLPSLGNFSGTKEKDRVVGKLNGGGARVDVHVSVGNLNLEAN
ncbi:DUF4097 family beta strand repeat-containing protein [Olivibacter sp. CPCC 100613]|uniref:DUF4097 family beta strand repeat-containing protein n=1 Tax=Olivibacter sp. CPCC 100613 TaxID=3079931 RepID=UPI002FF47CE5